MKYEIDLEQLIKNYNIYKGFGQVYFPVKTNPNTAILNQLIDLDSGFEIDSINHIKLVIKLLESKGKSLEPGKIIFSNVSKTFEEIDAALDLGITYFTIDDMSALEHLVGISKNNQINNLKVNIRLNIYDVFQKNNFYLGASIDNVKSMIDYLSAQQGILYGLSFYIQPELFKDKDSLYQVIKYINDNFGNGRYKFNFVNIGGGNNIERMNESIEFIKEVARNVVTDNIILEPGRDLVNNVVDLYGKIKRVKPYNENVDVLSLDVGIYSGLLDIKLHNRQFEMYLQGKAIYRLIPVDGGYQCADNEKMVVLRGPTADSSDILGVFKVSRDAIIQENDSVMIKNASAYVETLESEFCGIKEEKEIKYKG